METASDIMTTNTKKQQGKKLSAFSLAEALLAVVILTIAAAGVLIPYTTGAVLRAEGARRTMASRLASDLMEVILTKPFHDPDGSSYDYNLGPDAGEATFVDFDNLDDFDGYSEPQGQIKDADGVVFTDPAYANFSTEAACSYVYVPQESGNTQPMFMRAEVTIYYKTQKLVTLKRLISK